MTGCRDVVMLVTWEGLPHDAVLGSQTRDSVMVSIGRARTSNDVSLSQLIASRQVVFAEPAREDP